MRLLPLEHGDSKLFCERRQKREIGFSLIMFSDEYFTMHLTPHGWMEGTEKTANGLVVRSIPDSVVFSLTFHETVSGILSHPEQRVDAKYQIDVSSDILKILFDTYGKLPERFEKWKIKIDW